MADSPPWEATPPWEAKPAPKPAAAPPWAPPPSHGATGGWDGGIVSSALGKLEQAGDYVKSSITGLPAARREAQTEQTQMLAREKAAAKARPFGGVRQAAADIGSDISGAFKRQVIPSAKALKSDFTAPLSAKHPVLDAAARPFEALWNLGGTVLGVPSSVITGIAGRDIQAKTGINRDVAGELLLGGTHPAGVGPAIVHEAPPIASRAYRAVRGAFDPSQRSDVARTTALFMRKSRGTNQLQADRAGYQLEKLDQRMKFSAQSHEDLKGFYDFMERRSAETGEGKKGAILQGAPALSADEAALAKRYGLTTPEIKAANQFRDIYQGYADKAEKIVKANTGSTPQFIKDYYAHMWQQPEAEVERRMDAWAARQGSGVNLRKRAIPTIADGMEMGLTPKFGPVQTTQLYAANMSRFLSTNENLAFLKQNGYAQWFRPGKQPADWVPLDGILTERKPKLTGGGRKPGPEDVELGGGPKLLTDQRREGTAIGEALREAPGQAQLGGRQVATTPPGIGQGPGAPQLEDAAAQAQRARVAGEPPAKTTRPPVGDQAVQKEKLFARPDVARLYNNEVSQGFRPGQGPLESVAYAAHKAAMADMLYKFSFSAYHAANVSIEAVANGVSNAVQNLSRGSPLTAIKRLAAAPITPIRDTLRGQVMREELRGQAEAATPFTAKINERFVKAGGKLHMDRDYRATGARTFYDSFKNGTFKADAKREAQRIFGKDVVMRDRAIAGADVFSNIMTSFSGVLFEDIIPQMKMGAFATNMGDWLKRFPNATEAEQEEYAARLLDSLDNRQGELIRDNMFWKKKTQQALQITMLAPTFKIGTWREILGGIHDIPESLKGIAKGKGVTPRTAYALVGLPVTVALTNEVAQYLKTGKPAESPRDLMAYRTGGHDPRLGGAPERGLIPGNIKDVYEAADALHPGSGGLPSYMYNSLNDLSGTLLDLSRNRDYADHPIYGPGARPGATADYLANRGVPISLSQYNQGNLRGSNLSPAERIIGVRSAPVSVSNPAGLARVRASVARKEAKASRRADLRRQQNYPATKPAAKAETPPWEQDATPPWDAPIKPGASNAGSVRPEFQPVVDLVRGLPGVRDIGALNDSYHPAGDVHGQGRAADVSLLGGARAAPAFIAALKAQLKARGITNIKITDEYAHPSARATAGHVHIEMVE